MDTKGGRYGMNGNGQNFTGRGEATIIPSRIEPENFANSDGTGSATVKPMLAEAEITFDRGNGLPWDETMLLQSWDFTFVEKDAGVTHLFTGARFAGRASIKVSNGEVTGLKLQSDQYQVLFG
jgi:hypothetical protein